MDLKSATVTTGIGRPSEANRALSPADETLQAKAPVMQRGNPDNAYSAPGIKDAWQRLTGASAPASLAERAAELRQMGKNVGLTPRGLAFLDEILRLVPASVRRQDLDRRLYQLLKTDEAPPAKTEQVMGEKLASGVTSAQEQYQAPGYDSGLEERIAASPLRHWEVIVPTGPCPTGKSIRIDRSNPKDVVIQIKVRLTGAADFVAQTKLLKDAIEKHLAIPGFTVDLVFVDQPGPDVFEATVDPTRWVTQGNWIGSAPVLAHELMHCLGLPDEYDYTSHATNVAMPREQRLYWFLVQLKKGDPPPDAEQGIMCHWWNKPLARHVREAAGLPAQPVAA